MVLRIWLYLFVVLLLGGLPVTVTAAETEAAAQPAEKVAVPEFPGLSELGPRSTQLADFVAKAREELTRLAALDDLENNLQELDAQFRKLSEEIRPLGAPEDWYVDRLTQYLNQFAELRQRLDSRQEELATRQQAVERIRSQARRDRDYWRDWAAELKKRQVKAPQQTLDQVNGQLRRLTAEVEKNAELLLPLQERAGRLQGELITAGDKLTQALDKLRKATFRKNAHSFVSERFYRQFDLEMWRQAGDGAVAVLTFDPAFFTEYGFQIGLTVAIFLATSGGLLFYRRRFEDTEQWRFIFRHPSAAGCFIAIALFWLWSPALPALPRFLLQICVVTAVTSMAVSLVDNRRQAWVLSLAALVFVVTAAFRMISLPQPLFRIYIALLAVLFIPPLVQQIGISRRVGGEKGGRFFRVLLRLAVAVLAVSLVGQVAGYINFSTWLIQATFETGMLILFARMILLLGNGAIDVMQSLMTRSGRSFFSRYGDALTGRLKRLLKVCVICSSIFYLLPVWRLFTTLNEAWTTLTQFGFHFGEVFISTRMLLSALLAFYLAMQLSWLLQGMSETQFFVRRPVDRGVRDAVKKLIHYGVVLTGFLIALGFLGMRLRNFVVLLGAFGVGIGFGLQDIVNNFLSGLILLFERPIKVGDGILIDGEYGTVTRIGLRSTVVENLNLAELIVPNSQIISQKVTNWTLSNRRVRLVAAVGVAYGSDLEKVLRLLAEVAQRHPDVLEDPRPTPLFIRFGASSLDFELRVWIADVDHRPRVLNELLLEIDRRFREEQVEIPFPQHDLHLRSVDAKVLSSLPQNGQ